MLYAHILLDRSGSMASIRTDTVGGYNTYCAQLPDDALVSLTIFDSLSVDLIRDAVTKSKAILHNDEFVPRGSTPLLDAVGKTVPVAAERAKARGIERVAFVILTDGLENCSHEWSNDKIAAMLKEKQDKDHWLVIYLGANQDAWHVGQAMGMRMGQSMSYDTAKVGATLASAGMATSRYANAKSAVQGQNMADFTSEERARSK